MSLFGTNSHHEFILKIGQDKGRTANQAVSNLSITQAINIASSIRINDKVVYDIFDKCIDFKRYLMNNTNISFRFLQFQTKITL